LSFGLGVAASKLNSGWDPICYPEVTTHPFSTHNSHNCYTEVFIDTILVFALFV